MRRRAEQSKQLAFPVLMGLIMVLLLIVVPAERMGTVKAATVLGDQQQNHDTSTESVLGQSYEELIASLNQDVLGDYISTLKLDESYVIPGISKTNIQNERSSGVMTPQGICVTEDYLIISAYDKSDGVKKDLQDMCGTKNQSVLYIIDVKSGQYLTTISLATECHVGALAYNPDDALLYIADSANDMVQKLSLARIEDRVMSGLDSAAEVMEFDEGAIDTQGYKPSFLAYYQNHLYVGQFAKQTIKELFSNRMAVYKKDGTLLDDKVIPIPYYAQGVTFAEWGGDTYMLVSTSFGRMFTSKLHVYLMDEEEDGSLQRDWKVGELSSPNMSEDLDIVGDCIYTCYESAANFYRLALDGRGRSNNVVDRILVSSLETTLIQLMSQTSNRCDMPVAQDDRIGVQWFEYIFFRMLLCNRQEDYFMNHVMDVKRMITYT